MSDLFSSLKISGSGLSVFRRKMTVAAENLANVETTKTDEGGPYQKKTVQISAKSVPQGFASELKSAAVEMQQTDRRHLPQDRVSLQQGLSVAHARAQEYIDRQQEPKMVYDPSHPDADEEGFVAMPDIDPLVEMVEMMAASRGYEANVAAIQSVKSITKKALEI